MSVIDEKIDYKVIDDKAKINSEINPNSENSSGNSNNSNNNSNSNQTNKQKNSKNRLFGLDVARLFAMLMMMQGHTVYCLLDKGIIYSGDWYWNLWTFMRGLTAPIFLMVSGAVHIFANKRNADGEFPNSTAKRRIRICLMLFVVSYMMQFPANNIFDVPFLDFRSFNKFFSVNVLQMFAVTLIFLTVLFKITKNNKQLAIIALILGNIIIFSSHFMLQIRWFDILPPPFASYFSMINGTIFPLFPFSGYLLIGSFIGYLLQQKDKEIRNNFLIKICFLLGIPYVLLGFYLSNWYSNGGFEIIGRAEIQLGISVYRVGLAMFAIAIAAFLSKFFTKFSDIISMLSKKSLFLYVIHLIIIYGSPLNPGIRNFFFNVNIFTAFYCAFFVIFFSIFLVYIYDLTQKSERINTFYKFGIVALIIFMMFI